MEKPNLVLLLLFIVVSIVISCSPESKKSSGTESEETGWIILFDGSSMDQWHSYNGEGIPEEWSIIDGAMVFTPSEDGGKNIVTNQDFESFELSLEWKISKGGNSGIFWAVNEDTVFAEAYETGPEIQVLDNPFYPNETKNHLAGALYDMIDIKEDATKAAGEWNLCRIVVDHKNNNGSSTLNGKLIAEFPVHGEAWNQMVSKSKFADWKGFAKTTKGKIGLQDHGNQVSYRNIKVRPIN